MSGFHAAPTELGNFGYFETYKHLAPLGLKHSSQGRLAAKCALRIPYRTRRDISVVARGGGISRRGPSHSHSSRRRQGDAVYDFCDARHALGQLGGFILLFILVNKTA